MFHHWVRSPFRAGQISVRHPVKLAKAGLALLFTVHEVKAAYSITRHSHAATLRKLNSVLARLTSGFQNAGTFFQRHPSSLTDQTVGSTLNNLNSQVSISNSILCVPDASVSQLGSFL